MDIHNIIMEQRGINDEIMDPFLLQNMEVIGSNGSNDTVMLLVR
jgi:hypothetical protein